MAENNSEQIIGGKPKPFFIPDIQISRVEPLKPVERPTIPASQKDPIIDFTSIISDSKVAENAVTPKRFSDTLKELEDCVGDPQERKRLQDIAADFVQHRG